MQERLRLYSGAEGKFRTLSDLLGEDRVSVFRPPDFEEDHSIIDPEHFILEKTIATIKALKASGVEVDGREVGLVHDFMAIAKVLGEVRDHVFLNKPENGEESLLWFWEKMNSLKEQAMGGVVELIFRNLVGLFKLEYLGGRKRDCWKVRYDCHMETVRLYLSPKLLALISDWDELNRLNEIWRLENPRSAGGVNLMEGLLPMLLNLAAAKKNDDLFLSISHRVAMPGQHKVNGVMHEIDVWSDLSLEEIEFLRRFAMGFSPELVRGLELRVDQLMSGRGRILRVI